MKTILSEIISYKKAEVIKRIRKVPMASLLSSQAFSETPVSLRNALLNKEGSGIIAEFKSKSPSAGIINSISNVCDVTTGYIKAGASALSVLTDNHFFDGSFENFSVARKQNSAPMLQKDFIIDRYQVYEARSLGADAILLIAAVLSRSEVKKLSELCRELGMESILEIHSSDELDHLCPEIDIVGINSRNLKTFRVDMANSINLVKSIPDEFVKVAESGINTPEDVICLSNAGFSGFLIGSRFMSSPDPVKSCRDFIMHLNKIKQC